MSLWMPEMAKFVFVDDDVIVPSLESERERESER